MNHSHEIEVRIYYEDTDCGGVVYYANYLRYFERARTSHLEALGIDMKGLTEEKHFFVVTRASLDYHSPAHYGDRLVVESNIAEVGGASLTFDHVVKERNSGRRLVTGRVRLASVGPEGRVERFPGHVASSLKAGPTTN